VLFRSLAGIATVFVCYVLAPDIPARLAVTFRPIYVFLVNKWFFDDLYNFLFVRPYFCLARQLWQVGIYEIFADGSFVEDKDHPNDIDGYFVCDLKSLASGLLTQQLNRLDPYKVWTWDPASRRPYRGYPKRQLPMWHRYRVELYPHVPGLGLGSGIRDKFGHELEFPSAFRQSRRDGKPRGIVKIKYGGQS
jgi:hypothetical protein